MSKILPTKVSYLSGESSVPEGERFDFFEQARAQRFGEVYFKYDEATGLKAIIAIHNTNLGPALGGTRCFPYGSSDAALHDAMRLARSERAWRGANGVKSCNHTFRAAGVTFRTPSLQANAPHG